MSTSKRFGRLAQPIVKRGRSVDVAGMRRKQQKQASYEQKIGRRKWR